MAVYLLHFAERYPNGTRPQHYIGWAKNVAARVRQHRAHSDARLMQVVNTAGIAWHVARVWPNGDRALERRLKRWNKGSALCPDCRLAARGTLPLPLPL